MRIYSRLCSEDKDGVGFQVLLHEALAKVMVNEVMKKMMIRDNSVLPSEGQGINILS
jgi:hypothetical protein